MTIAPDLRPNLRALAVAVTKDRAALAQLYADAMVLTERAIITGTDRDDRVAQAAYDRWAAARDAMESRP